MAAPTAFSAHLEKWIFQRTKDSIVFIQVKPKLKFKDDLMDLMKKANTVPLEKRHEALDKDGDCCTGFIVGATATHFRILTTAHVIDHVFRASNPISVVDANRLFHVQVLCDHYESSFRLPGQNAHSKRVYGKAEIIGLSCQRDMMLIGIPRENVKDLTKICINNHPPLVCSSIPPTAFDECVMISWPPLKHRSTAKGRISHPVRTMADSGLPNPASYNMNIMQVQLESEYGSSGAPLLNGSGKVIGMLHGGFGRSFSYFVALNEIGWFLRQQGVIAKLVSIGVLILVESDE
ncbi:hypothetical protein ACQ4PT_031967 [Festuca glaucescens]